GEITATLSAERERLDQVRAAAEVAQRRAHKLEDAQLTEDEAEAPVRELERAAEQAQQAAQAALTTEDPVAVEPALREQQEAPNGPTSADDPSAATESTPSTTKPAD